MGFFNNIGAEITEISGGILCELDAGNIYHCSFNAKFNIVDVVFKVVHAPNMYNRCRLCCFNENCGWRAPNPPMHKPFTARDRDRGFPVCAPGVYFEKIK